MKEDRQPEQAANAERRPRGRPSTEKGRAAQQRKQMEQDNLNEKLAGLTVADVNNLDRSELSALRNHLKTVNPPDVDPAVREAIFKNSMRSMGQVSTPAKTAAVRLNAKLPRQRESWPLSRYVCTCGKCPPDGVMPKDDFKPLTTCKRGLAIYNRRYHKKPMNP